MSVARGFQFAGLHSGIKPNKKDLALVYSPTPCSAAAALTANTAKAAPVIDAAARVPATGVHAVVINSGNANALTGPTGLEDVQKVHEAVAAALKLPGGAAGVLSASTGVIGVRLPKEKIIDAIPRLVGALTVAPETAAEAILTTDTRMKVASRTLNLNRKQVTLSAICKGSGMIAPQLATMIAVVTTDAAISPSMLQQALTASMDGSFNNLTVDNDMSTNDVVFALANGLAGNTPITDPGADYEKFRAALYSLCQELAREIAADGEGATKLLEVKVTGAPTAKMAADFARAIAGSSLVKASIFGADPNWGRVLATVGARAGSQGWAVDPHGSRVTIQGICVYDKKPTLDSPARLKARMREPEVKVNVELRLGEGEATAWGCDLSYDYVKINADYTSLLKSAADGSVSRDDRLTNYSPSFKVTLLTQALSYISRFADKRCVLKLGKAALAKDSLRQAFCEDVNLLKSVGMVPIVVHGEAPGASGDAKLREVLVTGSTNLELVTLLNRNGSHAIGVSGQDGGLLRAKKGASTRGEFSVGDLLKVNAEMLEMFLAKGYVPVIAPVGITELGESVPLDADQVAAMVAKELNASKLVLLTGATGLTVDDELVQQMPTSLLEAHLKANAFEGNLLAKAKAALWAANAGVERVHVIDARTPHSVIAELFTDQGVGTLVTVG
ncbi:MAG: Acetylglutamate kinase [Myxococcaceae bacterium]|nr:Acetylglutamate kinase [Myxococcaceae bacterium]